MKILYRDSRIIGTATDEYTGPELFLDAPPGFSIDDAARYIIENGALVDVPPKVVTIRQAKLALLQAGLLDAVNAAVAGADRSVQIEWEYVTEIRRDWPTLTALQPALGLTDEQVDNLFRLAAAL